MIQLIEGGVVLTEVADGVLVHQSALLENNTVVVRGSAGVLLVDPGITEAELTCLADDLRALGQPVVAGFSTHPDWDHVLWHPELGDVARYGTARCASRMHEVRSAPGWRDDAAAGLPPEIADEVPLDLYGEIVGLPAGAREVPWDGPRTEVVEHPAHAPGHAALLVREAGVLVAGDMLSDVLVPMFDEPDGTNDPVAEYLVGLKVIDQASRAASVVVPGHGSVGDAHELRVRIDRDRAYVESVRDGQQIDDPRLGASARPGWEWVSDLHAGNVQRYGRSSSDD